MVLRDGRERNQRPQYRKKKIFWGFCFEFSRKLGLTGERFCFLRPEEKVCFTLKDAAPWGGGDPGNEGQQWGGWAGGWGLLPLSLHGGRGRVRGTASCSPPRTGKHMKRAWAPESGSKLGLQWPGKLPPGCLYLSGILPAPCCALGLEWGFQHVGPWGTLI